VPHGNKICAKRVDQRRHELHLERLKNVKPMVDTSRPMAIGMDHVRNNLKREQIMEERYSEIDRENRILLKKMSDIMKPQTTPRDEKTGPPPSLNRFVRKQEMLRITMENQSILKRIQEAQPTYSHVEWEGEHKKNMAYLRNAAEYPLVIRQPRRNNLVGKLSPLGDRALQDGAPFTARVHRSKELALSDGAVRCVLKEGVRLGEAYYLVEMMTDGSTLSISAFEGESRITSHVTLKEKHHRRLYREVNGDYARIIPRLRVEGRRVVVEGAHGVPQSARGHNPSIQPVTRKGESLPAPVNAWTDEEPQGTARGFFRPPSPTRHAPLAYDDEAVSPRAGVKGEVGGSLNAEEMVLTTAPEESTNPTRTMSSWTQEPESPRLLASTADNTAHTIFGAVRSGSTGSISAEIQINTSGDFQLNLRGLSPMSVDDGCCSCSSNEFNP